MSNVVAEDRVRKDITVSRQIRWAPLPLQANANSTACLAGPPWFAWVRCHAQTDQFAATGRGGQETQKLALFAEGHFACDAWQNRKQRLSLSSSLDGPKAKHEPDVET